MKRSLSHPALTLVVFLACTGSLAQAKGSAPAKPVTKPAEAKGMFEAGTTTLPAGKYRIINEDKGVEFSVTVESTGKMVVHSVGSVQQPGASVKVPEKAPAAAAVPATPPVTAVTPVQAATVEATGTAATTTQQPAGPERGRRGCPRR